MSQVAKFALLNYQFLDFFRKREGRKRISFNFKIQKLPPMLAPLGNIRTSRDNILLAKLSVRHCYLGRLPFDTVN